MKALLVIDVQKDFLPGGALAVPDGDQIVPVVNAMARVAKVRGELIVATQDEHPANHESFASQHDGKSVGDVVDLHGLEQILWPDHCVAGTEGHEFAEGLETDLFDAVFAKGTDPEVDSYSGFFDNGERRSTGLADWLNDRGVTSVTIVGLATDYCVKFTALDAVREGFDTKVVEAGIRAVELSPGDGERALNALRDAGVEVTPTP